MGKVRTQADRRRAAIFTDQHGRQYRAFIENDTMHPCSSLAPMFDAPLHTPDKYFKFFKEELGRTEVLYDEWISDLEEAHKDFDNRLGSSAVLLYGSGAARAIQSHDTELHRYVGPKPQPIEPVVAARQGNGWVLGLKKGPMPKWAIPFFTTPAKVETVYADTFEDVDDESPTSSGETIDDLGSSFTDNDEATDDELEAMLTSAQTTGVKTPTTTQRVRRMPTND